MVKISLPRLCPLHFSSTNLKKHHLKQPRGASSTEEGTNPTAVSPRLTVAPRSHQWVGPAEFGWDGELVLPETVGGAGR